MTQIERELHDHLPERRNISSARSIAPRGALVREVSTVEEPAESAVKEHQCVRYHRSKERKKSAKMYQTKRQGTPGGKVEPKRTPRSQSEEDSWGEHRLC